MIGKRLADILHSTEKITGFKTKRPVVELIGTCAQCTEKYSEIDVKSGDYGYKQKR